MDCTSLAAIEHAAVDGGLVRRARHQSVEDVELPNQMAFADAADRWVAAHLADILRAEGDQPNACAATRSRCSRLAARVTRANDQYVEHASRLRRCRGQIADVSRGTSLAEAKAPEQCVEHVIDARTPGDAIKRLARPSKRIGGDFDLAASGIAKRNLRLRETIGLASID